MEIRPATTGELSPGSYINEFTRYAENMYLPLRGQEEFLSRYCSNRSDNIAIIQEAGVAPAWRPDIVDPDYLRKLDGFTRYAGGASNAGQNWYTDYSQAKIKLSENRFDTTTNMQRQLSARWETFFAPYIRMRRLFHAAFLQAVATDISPQSLRRGFNDAPFPATMPPISPSSGYGDKAINERVIDFEEWVTYSTVSTLMLPPEAASTDMKRGAVDMLAQLVNKDRLVGAYSNPQKSVLTGSFAITQSAKTRKLIVLPHAMRQTHQELAAPTHPQWHQNAIIQQYFGTPTKRRAHAFEGLLYDRPEDYLQVLLLHMYDSPERGLQKIHEIPLLPTDIQDAIFAPYASFVTVHGDGGAATDRQHGLADVLRDSNDPQSLLRVVDMQKMTIAGLRADLAARDTDLAARIAENALLKEQLANQHATVGNQLAGAELFREYGIDPEASDENILALVSYQRRVITRQFHPEGRTPNEELYKDHQEKLDTLLRIKGLTNLNDPNS